MAGKIKSWSNTEFKIGATTLEVIPETSLREVAFAGRSNVGKSSLINSITGRNSLTRVSRTPGCTRQLNFFEIENHIYLVDMPGYGYAKASKGDQITWGRLIINYLSSRPLLRRVFILVDSRLGFKQVDFDIMGLLDKCAVSYQVIFTKSDKLDGKEIENLKNSFIRITKKHPALHPEFILTSSVSKEGVEKIREEIEALI